jgi:Txe/YoeB family toxin of Txe-Axe toxin-antitoxin module
VKILRSGVIKMENMWLIGGGYTSIIYNNYYTKSIKIDEKNRLVYDIDELQNIKIISCRGHYDD